jgi:hypothetical protein
MVNLKVHIIETQIHLSSLEKDQPRKKWKIDHPSKKCKRQRLRKLKTSLRTKLKRGKG